MKRNKLSIKTKTINLALIGLFLCVFSACLKDKGPGAEDYSHSPALISFQYSGFSFKPFVASVLGTPEDSMSIEVTLSVASLTLKSDVSATISADDATLAAFNADTTRATYPTIFTQLPSTLYTTTLQGGKITIPAGQQKVSFSIHFVGDQLDFSQDNALALKMTDAQGATIPTNLNTFVIIIKPRSPLEGNYAVVGKRYNYTGVIGYTCGSPIPGGAVSTATSPSPKFAATIDPETVSIDYANLGASGYQYVLKIDPTDPTNALVSSNADLAAGLPNVVYCTHTYDAALKQFHIISFYNNGADDRVIEETFTLP